MLITPSHLDDFADDDASAALLAELNMEFEDDRSPSSASTATSAAATPGSSSVGAGAPVRLAGWIEHPDGSRNAAELGPISNDAVSLVPTPTTTAPMAVVTLAREKQATVAKATVSKATVASSSVAAPALNVHGSVRPKRSRPTGVVADRRAPRAKPAGPPPPISPEVKTQLDELLKPASARRNRRESDRAELLAAEPIVEWSRDGKAMGERIRHQIQMTMASPDLLRHLALMFIASLAAIVVAAKLLGGGLNTPNADRAAIATEDMVRQIGKLPVVRRVAGSYVPKIGVIVTIDATDINVDEAAGWWAASALPYKSSFDAYRNERIFVTIDVASTRPFTRAFVAPLNRISEPVAYQPFSGLGVTNPDAYQPFVRAPSNSDSSKADGSASIGSNPAAKGAGLAASTATPASSLGTKSATKSAGSDPTSVAAPSVVAIAPTLPTSGADDFAVENAKWKPFTGQWKFREGTYQQLDNTGFDFMTTFAATPTKDFAVSVKIKAIEGGPMNAGLVLFQSVPGKRSDATLVDFADTKNFLRWGHYDRGGVYVYDGGYRLTAPLNKTKAVKLSVEVRSGKATVLIDGKSAGAFTPYKTLGGVGLATSIAKVAFDDFSLSPLK
jgi:hypothetical protein